MPGIAGILLKDKRLNAAELLESMLASMMHETFYTKASHADQLHGWYCGSVAIKGSFSHAMPVCSESQDVLAFLAGESFTDGQAIRDVTGQGHVLTANSPSHLLHLYEHEGPDFVKKLNGWLSGVILDTKRGRALLFNDRYGMCTTYYHEDAGAFYFASEAKSLLRVLPSLKEMDPRSVGDYLCFDCVLRDRSYFRGVDVLPGGSLWVFDENSAQKGCYYEPTQTVSEASRTAEDFVEELTSTFERVLPRYLSGETVAIALTGGLDTRLIMACLPSDCAHLSTFTFGGMHGDTMDVRLARKVSALCGLPHETVRLGSDFLSDYAQHASNAVYITDGLADATTADSIYLSKCVRKLAPTMVMGTFGSQVLGRVRRALRYRPPAPELVSPDFKAYIDEASSALEVFREESDLPYVLKREIPWYWSRFTVPQMSQLTIRSPFLDRDFVDLLCAAPAGGFDGSEFELRAIYKNRRQLMDIRTNKGAGGKAPPLISSLVSLLIRGRTLAEKALSWDALPHSLHHAVTKADALVLSPLRLNSLVLGFQLFRNYNLWFRRELAGYLRGILLDRRTLARPYWNEMFLKKMVEDHVRGRRRYMAEIRKVLTLELVHRVLLEDDR